MQEYIQTLLIICPLVFTAGFVDAIAGGGGIISVPAYILAGLPVHMAYGTNKFAMSLGTSVSTLRFARSGKIQWKQALLCALGALVGAWCGARAALALSEQALKISLMVVLPIVAVVLLWRQRKPLENKARPEQTHRPAVAVPIAIAIGFFIGGYDGLFGPGTGTFLILAFSGFLGMDLVMASGSAKVVNLASNLASLATYLLGAKVLFAVGIPAACCTILGNFIGSKLAIKNGERFVRPVIFIVLGLLLVKVLTDLT